MKYLEDGKLTQLTSALTDAELGGTNCRVINGRIESYTMKRAGTDKKYAHALSERYAQEMDDQFATYQQFVQRYKHYSKASSSPIRGGGRKRSQSVGNQKEQNAKEKGQRRARNRSSSFDHLRTTFKPVTAAGVTPINIPVSVGLPVSLSRPTSSRRTDVAVVPAVPLVSAMKRTQKDSSAGNGNSASNGGNILSPSPLGNFHEMGTRRLMTDLILTLNASFPDYDFGSVRPSHFIRIPAQNAVHRINERLSELASHSTSKGGYHLHDQQNFRLGNLWAAIDNSITLAESIVFSYVPPTQSEDDDPLAFLPQTLVGESCQSYLWSFNYFFVNKHLKRILLFSCVETLLPPQEDAAAMSEGDEPMNIWGVGDNADANSEIDFDLDPAAADVAGGIGLPVAIR